MAIICIAQDNKQLETICLGHRASLKQDCRKCTEDEQNKYCDKYKEVIRICTDEKK